MLISKANRKAIFTKLFKEGVMIAEKDFNAPAHPEFPEIPNLQIIKACQVTILAQSCAVCAAFRRWQSLLRRPGLVAVFA